MRRVLTTLMILLVVLVAGLSALVLLVNPNDFRAYMVRQVEARSGYELKLDGPLRWHVWPQLSILSGRMSLTAPGASAPLVSADNMRLDVALMPLISHQLQVNQVMLKGAVIQLTPQSEAVHKPDAPVAPRANSLPDVAEDTGWSFDIASLKVVDSVLVFQHEDEDQVTVRNINLKMEQDQHHLATLDFSGRINRNQRDMTLSLNANLNASDYPHQLTADIQQLNWQLSGADLPVQGITGQGSLQALWREEQKQLELNNLNLQANDSSLKGRASVLLGEQPKWVFDLQFDKLNLENLLPPQAVTTAESDTQLGATPPKQTRPVIASSDETPDYNGLRSFTADILLKANTVRWRGIDFTNVSSQMLNHNGLLVVSELSGQMGAGHLSLPGLLDVRKDMAKAEFQPRLENIEIGTILQAFNYPIALTGNLTMAGDFSGDKIDADAFRRSWQGQAHVDLTNSRMEGLNFQQLVQQAVERSSSNVKAQENFESATRLDSFTTDITLDNGQLSLDDMQGQSSLLDLSGKGTMDLVKETTDTRFNIRVLSGWKGDGPLIEVLKETPIPLNVYGKWQELNYSLQVDQILRKHLQDEAKRRLNEWADKNKDSQDSKDVKKLLDKL